MDDAPVVVDLNVDAALLLKKMVGIDALPMVLVLIPTIFDAADQARVDEVMLEQLTEAGIVVDGRVHPTVEHWLQCMHRPDMDLEARLLEFGPEGKSEAMLRLSLVRAGDTHVLAVRCDDSVVIQPVFNAGNRPRVVSAVLAEALGSSDALPFEPITAKREQFATVSMQSQDILREGLIDIGGDPQSARVVSRAMFEEEVRRAEIVMTEHHDGGSIRSEFCVTVIDTRSGRVVVTPRRDFSGEAWVTWAPGDDATLQAAVTALTELLPGRSWFDTSRTEQPQAV